MADGPFKNDGVIQDQDASLEEHEDYSEAGGDDNFDRDERYSDLDDPLNALGHTPDDDDMVDSVDPLAGHDDEDDEEEMLAHSASMRVNPGTYLFAIGPPQSGKTTFQSALVHYLLEGEDDEFLATPVTPMPTEAQLLFKNWRRSWKERRFPNRTNVAKPTVITFNVEDLKYRNAPTKFGIIEVSGEDYERAIDPTADAPALPPIIGAYLKHPRVKFIFAFVCMGHKPGDADDLFYDILTHLSEHYPEFENRCRAMIVISNPKSAKKLLADKLNQPVKPGPLNKMQYVATILKKTQRRLLTLPGKYKLAELDVGAMERKVGPSGQEEIRIKRFSHRSAQKIFYWVYAMVAGRSHGPKRINRFLGWLVGEPTKKPPKFD